MTKCPTTTRNIVFRFSVFFVLVIFFGLSGTCERTGGSLSQRPAWLEGPPAGSLPSTLQSRRSRLSITKVTLLCAIFRKACHNLRFPPPKYTSLRYEGRLLFRDDSVGVRPDVGGRLPDAGEPSAAGGPRQRSGQAPCARGRRPQPVRRPAAAVWFCRGRVFLARAQRGVRTSPPPPQTQRWPSS